MLRRLVRRRRRRLASEAGQHAGCHCGGGCLWPSQVSQVRDQLGSWSGGLLRVHVRLLCQPREKDLTTARRRRQERAHLARRYRLARLRWTSRVACCWRGASSRNRRGPGGCGPGGSALDGSGAFAHGIGQQRSTRSAFTLTRPDKRVVYPRTRLDRTQARGVEHVAPLKEIARHLTRIADTGAYSPRHTHRSIAFGLGAKDTKGVGGHCRVPHGTRHRIEEGKCLAVGAGVIRTDGDDCAPCIAVTRQ